MLETLEDPDVRHMSTETPEQQPDALFDADRDISQEDWQVISHFIDESLTTGHPDLIRWYLQCLVLARRINPNFGIKPDQELKETLENTVYKFENPQGKLASLIEPRRLLYAREAYPDIVIEKLDTYKQHWKEWVQTLEEEDFVSYAESAPAMLALGLTKEDIGWDQDTESWLKRGLAKSEEDDHAAYYAIVASGLRILSPDTKIIISEKMADSMRNLLADLKRSGHWLKMLRLAASMQDLNNKGDSLPSDQIPAIPERRDF